MAQELWMVIRLLLVVFKVVMEELGAVLGVEVIFFRLLVMMEVLVIILGVLPILDLEEGEGGREGDDAGGRGSAPHLASSSRTMAEHLAHHFNVNGSSQPEPLGSREKMTKIFEFT